MFHHLLNRKNKSEFEFPIFESKIEGGDYEYKKIIK